MEMKKFYFMLFFMHAFLFCSQAPALRIAKVLNSTYKVVKGDDKANIGKTIQHMRNKPEEKPRKTFPLHHHNHAPTKVLGRSTLISSYPRPYLSSSHSKSKFTRTY